MRGACDADAPWHGYRQKFRVFFREAFYEAEDDGWGYAPVYNRCQENTCGVVRSRKKRRLLRRIVQRAGDDPNAGMEKALFPF